MKLSQIVIRDPFVLADKNGKYYMYASSPSNLGRGFCAYESTNLVDWSEPFVVFDAKDFWAKDNFWAPEVHFYKGKYYLFGTFGTNNVRRTSQILVADNPKGPFKVHSEALAPLDWFALDATLYVENDVPYAIFSHEWVQVADGEACFVKLKDDLSALEGSPCVMFKASQSGWSVSPEWNTTGHPVYIVDAPFVYNIDGVQFMLWSSWSSVKQDAYSVGVVYPLGDNMLCGKYKHQLLKLPHNDSGHAMIFKDFDGNYRICYHEDNSQNGKEHAAIYYVGVKNKEVVVYEK